ncbi:sialate O-acetylesterase [Edaphobacter paludis]|uniref:Sialate O-acetylesterase n=1 Tax=Edaphobacter paludis TaxID=3035702 RepID=A0AAU7CYM8_9BACT
MLTQRLRFIGAGVLFLLPFATSAAAEIRLPHLFSDHTVLQREAPIHIWGWSQPEEKVTVRFHAQTRSAEANAEGEWSLWLMPEQAGGPYTLTAQGSSGGVDSAVTFSDILVGDVWVASGQSNMEFPLKGFGGNTVLKNGAQEIAQATVPQVRLLRIEHKSSDIPVEDVDGTWTLCTPETAANFSAVAYFFGREISQKEHVPIGLIDATWGGTPVASWISLDGIGADASLMPLFATRARFADEQSSVPRVEAAEKREDAAALGAHHALPKHPWHPDETSWVPAALFNGMISPMTPYSIKGVIWYQGESDSAPATGPIYAKSFSTMIGDWRSHWHEGNFPFLFVQISSYNSPGELWGIVRDQQRRTLAVSNTAMAVSLDVGTPDNVHPPDKQTVGARLAVAARGLVYGEAVDYSGPLFRQATRDGSGIRVWFDHAAGLRSKGGPLTGFEIAGADKQFVPAAAVIQGSSVEVTSSAVKNPEYVRYGWENVTAANLYNRAELPASTFTSE